MLCSAHLALACPASPTLYPRPPSALPPPQAGVDSGTCHPQPRQTPLQLRQYSLQRSPHCRASRYPGCPKGLVGVRAWSPTALCSARVPSVHRLYPLPPFPVLWVGVTSQDSRMRQALLFSLFNLFILIYLFLAALGLWASRGYSSLRCPRASHCCGFSRCGARALGAQVQ